MLGGEFLSHGSQQEGRVKVVDTSFPGLQGCAESFTTKEEMVLAQKLLEGHPRPARS
jgi:hypothetical protein